MATWEKIDKATDNGNIVSMQAPIIVSASRSTDIPAFYADWFFKRLEKGYSAWTNPFNGVKSYVSYDNTRFIVFWSKNPKHLLHYHDFLKKHDIKCYIQYTLNDYEEEKLEKVPPLAERIDTFKRLVEEYGHGAVIWRFDPMILTKDITIDKLLNKVQIIGDKLKGYTEKLVFSYADIATYRKVKHNLKINGIDYHEWETKEMEIFAEKLSRMNKDRRWNFQLATCGEKIDISKYGIQHNRCIDGDLIARLAWEDKVLMNYMKIKIETKEASLFGDVMPEGAIPIDNMHYFISTHKKDQGQRPFCECMASKDIGEYNTCPHLCEYCYANTNKQMALDNYNKHRDSPNNDRIV